jgi:fatty-acyl-CoA synthase
MRPVAERQAALEARFPSWAPRTLDQALDAAAAEFPERPFVITDEATYTYSDVAAFSARIARGLIAAGVRPGEHVAVLLANYPEFVAVKYAISRAGAVAVPINFWGRRDELGYILAQSDAALLITMDSHRDLDYLAMLDELAPGWEQAGGGERLPRLRRVVVFPTGKEGGRTAATHLAELAASGDESLALPVVDPHSPADVLYTSGTTGSPKGVLLSHDMLLRTAYGSAYARGFENGRRVIFALPMYHVYGYVEGMLAVGFVGGAIVPQLRFDPLGTLEGIARHRATDALFIPTMTLAVLDELERGEHDLSSLSSLISSGGAAPAGHWGRLEKALPTVELTTGYGMSETTASTTVTRPDDPPERRRDTNGRMREVGVAGEGALGGRLAAYKTVDPHTGADLDLGEVGELVVRGPGVTAGYYHKPDETAAAFDADGWLHTGDLGLIDPDGYLALMGRVTDCYRCGGEQVVPTEIENVLTAHPAVAQAHVVGIPDERMGEIGAAWIVPTDGAAPTAGELVDYCAARMARFKIPRHVLFTTDQDVPRTPSGRPRKFLLAEQATRALSPAKRTEAS